MTIKTAAVEYRGQTFPGYNKPVPNRGSSQHKMMVLAKKGDQVKLVRFGHKGYGHNISPERKANYLKRSAGIRNKSGQLTKDDKLSSNYWARKVLWPKGEADGSARHSGQTVKLAAFFDELEKIGGLSIKPIKAVASKIKPVKFKPKKFKPAKVNLTKGPKSALKIPKPRTNPFSALAPKTKAPKVGA
jgi:hypothetical protein